jgi:hypothetical protein
MPSSWMLRREALVRTDVSEERIDSHHQGARIVEQGTLAVTSNLSLHSGLRLLLTANVLSSQIAATLMMETICSTET